jgi:hypothetical protein
MTICPFSYSEEGGVAEEAVFLVADSDFPNVMAAASSGHQESVYVSLILASFLRS